MDQFHAKGDLNNSYLLITGADYKDEFDVMLGLKNGNVFEQNTIICKSSNHD